MGQMGRADWGGVRQVGIPLRSDEFESIEIWGRDEEMLGLGSWSVAGLTVEDGG